MHRLPLIIIALSLCAACGGSPPTESAAGGESTAGGSDSSPNGTPSADSESQEFQLHDSDQSQREHPSQIESTETEAAIRFFVVDPETGPISGTVVKLTAPDGSAYYTGSTDSQGYAEMLVPAGQRYQLEYLSLGRRTTRASVNVAPGPRQDIRLTLRRRQWHPPARPAVTVAQEREQQPEPQQRFVLEGVLFDSGRATIQEQSYPRLDRVVEYMVHKPSARIRISGYTDSMGGSERNRQLSEARAQAVRLYLVAQDIDAGRIEAIGYGEEDPVASNDTAEGRAQNRRIEAVEL
ncbi:MAG: OmpA family protein [Deltaproteobacteria bacterium]|nr:OmpA family protein [Deltaproteobacteria bacterium]